MVSIGTIIGDRYEILEKVGSGAMDRQNNSGPPMRAAIFVM